MPLVMEVSPGTFERWTGFASEFARRRENASVGASGYHSPASFHKDDNRSATAEAAGLGIGPPIDPEGAYRAVTGSAALNC